MNETEMGAFRVGETKEMLTDYVEDYESIRDVKGYSKKDLERKAKKSPKPTSSKKQSFDK